MSPKFNKLSIIKRIASWNRSTINLDHVDFSGGKIVELEKSGSYLDICMLVCSVKDILSTRYILKGSTKNE